MTTPLNKSFTATKEEDITPAAEFLHEIIYNAEIKNCVTPAGLQSAIATTAIDNHSFKSYIKI